MKKIISIFVLSILLVLGFNGSVQGQPPPPSGAGHGATGNQQAGNAPVGSGLFVLLGLGAAYGGRKIYKITAENAKK